MGVMGVNFLAGDIGGTKTILALVTVKDDSPGLGQPVILFEQTYSSPAFSDLVPMVQQFRQEAAFVLGNPVSVAKACFAIAGPVVDNTCRLTNLDWHLSGDRLAQELAIAQVDLINDFAAVGYGILGLGSEDLTVLQSAPVDPSGAIAILGAGTGLGQCYVIPQGQGRYRVFASEGAHGDFAPRSPLEWQLLEYLKQQYALSRVSIERVVSGMGIAVIYEFLRHQYPERESAQFNKLFQTWHQEKEQEAKTVDLAAAVSQAALEGTDNLASQAMELFLGSYGAEAGNLALKFLPRGGLYVAGGIAPKIISLLEKGSFMQGFSDKGRMQSLMGTIPVKVVLNPKVGLIGAAVCAAQS
ncbi:glucokinase [Synechocystis salina]|uniref:Glucokinase n=2 Tax=Synechocystis TaxID=1142 RepID=A0ABR9VNH3_9SYNC|nr:glucokinase [Synechocystis salina]MBE9240477.1 glucokinase [Synechocystis salina LEGE 00041]MBE9252899.1 glucokinase [Synechocystis salina LEGE 00031]